MDVIDLCDSSDDDSLNGRSGESDRWLGDSGDLSEITLNLNKAIAASLASRPIPSRVTPANHILARALGNLREQCRTMLPPARQQNVVARVEENAKKRSYGNSMVTGNSNENNGNDANKKTRGAVYKVKKEKSSVSFSALSDEEDEVMEVEAPEMDAPSHPTVVGGEDGDFEVVGTKNVVALPHAREDCNVYLFHRDAFSHPHMRQNTKNKPNNALVCENCYCFVCDDLASKCAFFYHGKQGDHCNATAKCRFWRDERAAAKKKKDPSGKKGKDRGYPAPASASSASLARNMGNNAQMIYQSNLAEKLRSREMNPRLNNLNSRGNAVSTLFNACDSPLPPNLQDPNVCPRPEVATSGNYTVRKFSPLKCGHCGWWSLMEKREVKQNEVVDLESVGGSLLGDWCHYCFLPMRPPEHLKNKKCHVTRCLPLTTSEKECVDRFKSGHIPQGADSIGGIAVPAPELLSDLLVPLGKVKYDFKLLTRDLSKCITKHSNSRMPGLNNNRRPCDEVNFPAYEAAPPYPQPVINFETFNHRVGRSPANPSMRLLDTLTPSTLPLPENFADSKHRRRVYGNTDDTFPFVGMGEYQGYHTCHANSEDLMEYVAFESLQAVELISTLAAHEKAALKNNPDFKKDKTPKNMKKYVDSRQVVSTQVMEYDHQTNEGVLSVSIYARRGLFQSETITKRDDKFTLPGCLRRILAILYLPAPFRLADLYPIKLKQYYTKARSKNHLRIIDPKYGKYTLKSKSEKDKDVRQRRGNSRDSDANFEFNQKHVQKKDKDELESLAASITEMDLAAVKRHNEAVDEVNKQRKFTGSIRGGGGISSTDTSFTGLMRSFYTGFVLDQAVNRTWSTRKVLVDGNWRKSGLLANYVHYKDVKMRKFPELLNTMTKAWGMSTSVHTSSDVHVTGDDLTTFLHKEDWSLLYENALKVVSDSVNKLKKLNNFLSHCENLGHAPAPPPDGIDCELFDYQRQAVGWMIERENTPNWKHLWAELPPMVGFSASAREKFPKMYYSPCMDKLTFRPPWCGRGGFLCEQMGMGKTACTIAACKQNPMPTLVVRCSLRGSQVPPQPQRLPQR
mgnify:FL=1